MGTGEAGASVPVIVRTAVSGHLDGVVGGQLFGWMIVPEQEPAREIVLTVFVDGQPFGTVVRDRARPDVAETYGCDVRCGFSMDLSSLDDTRAHKVRVKATLRDCYYDFDGRTLYWCAAVEQHRELLSGIFVPDYYCTRHGLDHLGASEAFDHYVREGIYADLDPNPWFDTSFFRTHQSQHLGGYELPILAYLYSEDASGVRPSEHFDPAHYRASHTDLDDGQRPLAHYVKYGHKEGRVTEQARLPDRLVREIVEMTKVEPSIPSPDSLSDNIVYYPKLTRSTWDARRVRAIFPGRIDAVVCIPFLSLGGADLIASYALRALQEEFGMEHVLLIVTEDAVPKISSRLAPKTRVHCLCRDDHRPDLDERCATLHEILATLCPTRVVNANSHACWELYRRLGRQLSSELDLVAYLFCFDYGSDGRLGGYIADYLGETLPYLRVAICDNKAIIRDVDDLYGFAGSHSGRLRTAYTPVLEDFIAKGVTARRTPDEKGPTVLWTGRLARQKRPDRLVRIANEMPSITFEIFGPIGDAEEVETIVGGKVPNIVYRGTYESLAELEVNEYALFLNTSAWDGLPTVLVQMAGLGIPLVTSCVGGIDEFVDERTGWPVADDDSIEDYVAAIHRVIFDAPEAARRAEAALELVRSRHTWQTYKRALAETGLFERDAEPRAMPDIERRRYA